MPTSKTDLCFSLMKKNYRYERPRNVHWVVGLVRGQIDVGGEVHISELWKDSGYKGLVR